MWLNMGHNQGYKHYPGSWTNIRPNQFCIPVYNSTPYNIIILKNMFIADIEIVQNLNEFSKCIQCQ
jgi:hypothetical protein